LGVIDIEIDFIPALVVSWVHVTIIDALIDAATADGTVGGMGDAAIINR
jgi:uncharacterized membrane protein YebE (DUF533 family)